MAAPPPRPAPVDGEGYFTLGDAHFTYRQLALRLAMTPDAIERHKDGTEGIDTSTIGWLNDSLICACQQLLVRHFLPVQFSTSIVLLDTFFITSISTPAIAPPTPHAITKRIGGSLIDRCVLFIICIQNHWMLGAMRAFRSQTTRHAVHEQSGELCFYDSFALDNACRTHYRNAMGVPLMPIAQRIVQQLSIADETIRACRWRYTLGQLPVQRNSFDCGMHALLGLADLIRCGGQVNSLLSQFVFSFQAKEVPGARNFMAHELLTNATFVPRSILTSHGNESADDCVIVGTTPAIATLSTSTTAGVTRHHRRNSVSCADGSPTNGKNRINGNGGASSPREAYNVMTALDALSNMACMVDTNTAAPITTPTAAPPTVRSFATLAEAICCSCVRADDIFRTASEQGGWQSTRSTDIDLLEALERVNPHVWSVYLVDHDPAATAQYRARYTRSLVVALLLPNPNVGMERAFSIAIELDLDKRVIALPTMPTDGKARWCGREYTIGTPHQWLRPDEWPITATLEFHLLGKLYRFQLIRE